MASQIVRRADAARNIDRILESAIHVFAIDPNAGMNDVAAHAGVGRATLYRHFPSREDLMAAIKAQAREEAVTAVERCPLDEGSALDAIESIVREVIELGDRYRFITTWREDGEVDQEPRERISAALRTAVERGQRRGEITRGIPPEWAVTVIRSLMLAALEELSDGSMSDRDAERFVKRIVRQGLAPQRREKGR
ncbi:MAG TPA: helix-turn-helix domain-containing protein [Thermoleophilaceae bacterium]|jgi:AcrR family transcriptional regulator|nr:helix-turn-helix domain-containing protein [Thermoleophilaceae bacterium]